MKRNRLIAAPGKPWIVPATVVVCVIAGCATPGDLTDYSCLQSRYDRLAMSAEENARLVEALAEKTEHRLSLMVYVWKMNYDGPAWATATTDDDGAPRVHRFDKRLPKSYKTTAETPN